MIVNPNSKHEATLRVVLESDSFGREYFDQHESLDEILVAVKGLVESSLKQKDGVERIVAIAIVPKNHYGDEGGYGYGLGDDDSKCDEYEFDPMTDGEDWTE